MSESIQLDQFVVYLSKRVLNQPLLTFFSDINLHIDEPEVDQAYPGFKKTTPNHEQRFVIGRSILPRKA